MNVRRGNEGLLLQKQGKTAKEFNILYSNISGFIKKGNQ